MSAKTHDLVIAGDATIDAAEEDFDSLAHLVEIEKIETSEAWSWWSMTTTASPG